MPWSEAATVRFTSEDGVQKWEVPVSAAAENGIYRLIEFPHGRPNVRYKGEAQEGKRIIQLFGYSDLSKPLVSSGEGAGDASTEEADSTSDDGGVSNPVVVIDPTLGPEEHKAVEHAAEGRKKSPPPSY